MRRTPASAARFAPALAMLAAAAFLGGCAPTSKPILLQEKPAPAEQERQWSKYGAYYLTDELFVEVASLGNPYVKYIVNKKLKILSREGVDRGTIEVPSYSEIIPKKTISAWDSSGNPIKLDTGSIFREYRKTGKIIFPNVTPGCVLEVYIQFTGLQNLSVFEHWFSGSLPVAHGRLTFSYTNEANYAHAEYGPIRDGKTEHEGPANDLTYETWEVRNANPRGRLDYQDEIDVSEPRVSIVLRRYRDQPVITTWEKLSKSYEDFALKPSFFNTATKLKKKADDLANGLSSDEEKAGAVFHWVQDNISFKNSPLGSINPDKVMSSGQGNMWEITVVLKEMFKHLGMPTGVLVTRPRNLGGFDASFVTPLQLGVPLVTVTAGRRTLLAFPYARGAALGEYPEGYLGLSALSLAYKDSTEVPDFAGSASYSRSTFRIDASYPEAEQNLDLELGGYLAFIVRNALLQEKKVEVKDVFQRALTNLGTSNALKTCQLTDLEARGKPMRAKLVFTNPNQSVERKSETQLKLSHIFDRHFESYDTSRATGFRNSMETETVERVEVAPVPGRKLEAIIPCTDASTALFKVTCRSEESGGLFVFTRTVLLHKSKLSAGEMRLLYPQIAELNRISEARILLRGEPTAVSPKPKRKAPAR